MSMVQWLWFLGGHLDFLCCDPGRGAFLCWSGLPPQCFGPQCPTFGAMGIMCRTVCSTIWVLSCAVGMVLGGCRWWVTIAIVAGVDRLLACSYGLHPQVWSCLFPGMLDGEVVHSNISHLIGGCLEWLSHKFPKELSLMQYAWMIQPCSSCLQCSSLIILQQSISVLMCTMRSWGSSPSLATIS